MVELVAKEIVRNLIVVFLLVLVMLIAWDQSRAETVDLTLPPGDYYLVPVQPYTVVTIQSTPVDPPVLDTDGDGVNDDIDQCPDVPGADPDGCTIQPPDAGIVPNPRPLDPPVVQPTVIGANVAECLANMPPTGGFCEIPVKASDVWRTDAELSPGEKGVTGQTGSWEAWSGAAWDYPRAWFHGGGHQVSGMIDVYEFNFETGDLSRVYTPPPYDTILSLDIGGVPKFARRHGPELPEATHTYDGFNFDPSTGLVLLVTGFSYDYGWSTSNPEPAWPVVAGRGRGIYAWNFTDAEVKGIPPGEVRKVGNMPITTPYPALAPLGDGRFVVGDIGTIAMAEWVGDEIVVDQTTKKWADGPYTPQMDLIGDEIWRLNGLYWQIYDKALNRIESHSAARGKLNHEFSFAPYGDGIVTWNGLNKVGWQKRDGTQYLCVFDAYKPAATPKGPTLSKWHKADGYDDVYVGWSAALGHPVVYRHVEQNCEPVATYASPTLQEQVDAADSVVIADGHYQQGPLIAGSKYVDFQYVRMDQPHNNGFVTVDGGPHLIDHLMVDVKGRSALWLQYGQGQDVVIDGFDFQGQHTAVMAGGAHGHLLFQNGEVRDGQVNCPDGYGQCHNFYIGTDAKVTLDNVRSLRHNGGGHLFKSRSADNVIENSVLDGGDSNHSRIMDFPCGGRVEIRNSNMIQSPNSDNTDMISIAVEACRVPQSTLVLENTYWQANKPGATFLTTKETVDIQCIGNNVFVGVANPCQQP